MYIYLLKDTSEALPLLEEAIACCLESWGVVQRNRSDREKWLRTSKPPTYELNPFVGLLEQVRWHSPITAMKLEQIYENYGVTAGCYGATALIWLEARIDKFGVRILDELTDWERREFTYIDYMQDDEVALADFNDMLDCYQLERLRSEGDEVLAKVKIGDKVHWGKATGPQSTIQIRSIFSVESVNAEE